MIEDRAHILAMFGVTEEDLAALNEDGYVEARREVDAKTAAYLRWVAAALEGLGLSGESGRG